MIQIINLSGSSLARQRNAGGSIMAFPWRAVVDPILNTGLVAL